ncbi:MAG: hypothetical protein Q8Q85_00305 [Gemmatimonadales bacterium]|nr:hypothetical protein [Gemmatimonadales bacterium]
MPRDLTNVMYVSIQRCGNDYSCLLLQGFDHMGAGDVDCGAADDGDTTRDSTQMAAACCPDWPHR